MAQNLFAGFQGPVVLELWTEKFPDALDRVASGVKFITQKMIEGWQVYEGRRQKEGV